MRGDEERGGETREMREEEASKGGKVRLFAYVSCSH